MLKARLITEADEAGCVCVLRERFVPALHEAASVAAKVE
jgi:hypothetical protein